MQVPYFKASAMITAAGTELPPWNVDPGYLHMVLQAYSNGDAFLEMLLHADWMDASRESQGRLQRLNGNIAIEGVFEAVRQKDFGDRPSRIGAVHLFPELETARRFANEFRDTPRPHLHEVRATEGIPFSSDMDLVTPGLNLAQPLAPQLDEMRARAAAYWRGENASANPFRETILSGRAYVTRLVESVVL